jgi:hypothetical protein
MGKKKRPAGVFGDSSPPGTPHGHGSGEWAPTHAVRPPGTCHRARHTEVPQDSAEQRTRPHTAAPRIQEPRVLHQSAPPPATVGQAQPQAIGQAGPPATGPRMKAPGASVRQCASISRVVNREHQAVCSGLSTPPGCPCRLSFSALVDLTLRNVAIRRLPARSQQHASAIRQDASQPGTQPQDPLVHASGARLAGGRVLRQTARLRAWKREMCGKEDRQMVR